MDGGQGGDTEDVEQAEDHEAVGVQRTEAHALEDAAERVHPLGGVGCY